MVKHNMSGCSNPQVWFRKMAGISDSESMAISTDRTPDWRIQKGDFRNPGRQRPKPEQGYQMQQKPLKGLLSPLFLLNQHLNQSWGQIESCGAPVRSNLLYTLHTVSSRGKQRVLPGSISVWEGSQDLLSLYWPSSVSGGIYSLQGLPRGGSEVGGGA